MPFFAFSTVLKTHSKAKKRLNEIQAFNAQKQNNNCEKLPFRNAKMYNRTGSLVK
jgi:hypothetical protein